MQVKEGSWIIESGLPNFTAHWPERSERYRHYKEKELDGSLRKVLPLVKYPRAEMMLNEQDRKEMLIVGPGVDSELSTINSRGDIETKNPEIFVRVWEALERGHKQPRLRPDSLPLELGKKLAEEEAQKSKNEADKKLEAKRKKILEGASAK